jgi:chromosome segregation ATPase
MIGTAAINGDDTQHQLEQLELRFRQLQDALVSAAANYDALCEQPSSSERQVQQALQRTYQLQKQLAALQMTIEQLEDREDSRAMA